MILGDVSRLDSLPPELWRRLGERLIALDIAAAYVPIARVGNGSFEPASRALRRWYLRRDSQPVAVAMRLLMTGDAVPVADAQRALGDVPIEALVVANLLEQAEGDCLRCPFELSAMNGAFFFADDLSAGGAAVMGSGPLTALMLEAAMPATPIGKALDLGCGAGCAALALSKIAARVVATDVNPRALILARANLALHGVTNVELREGDLFAPVAGEQFDLVVSQPPFIAAPEGVERATFKHGGARGDELCLRALDGVSQALTPEGRGVFAITWPVAPGWSIEDRVRGAVSRGFDALLLEHEGPDLDAACLGNAAYDFPQLGPEFERSVLHNREHLARMGVEALSTTVVIIERSRGPSDWVSTLKVPAFDQATIDAAQIDAWMASRALLARGDEALLAAKLRIRPGTRFVDGAGEVVRVVSPEGALLEGIVLDRAARSLAGTLDASPNLRAGLKRFRKEIGAPNSAVVPTSLLPVVRALVTAGLLEVARD